MRLPLGFALVLAAGALAAGLSCTVARADDYQTLEGCVESGNAGCLSSVGEHLAESLQNPRDKSLMMARFALIDWASGNAAQGDVALLRAWSHLAEVPNEGCSPRIDATFAFEDLTTLFGNTIASRLVLRNLIKQAAVWPKDGITKCNRPAGEPNWMVHLAERQRALGDTDGLRATLDLALAWGMDPAVSEVNFAMRPHEAAMLLGANDRASDAMKICDASRARILGGLAPEAAAADQADAQWRALECYRKAGLKDGSQTAYQEFARLKLDAMGLADPTKVASGATEEESFGLTLWDLAQSVSWNDPILTPTAADAAAPGARDCFMQPTAQCLAAHAITFADGQKRGARKPSYGTAPDFHAPGTLDGFAQFLVGAGGDVVGDDARAWFLAQAQQAPLENLRAVVGNAAHAGDLVWARRIFYSWYTAGGEEYFHHLTDPTEADKVAITEDSWPLHVAWSIALVVNELDPAFEPEELASFAETAWDDGIAQLPPLRDIPPTELVDADERSGAHLLDLCFRDAFGEWAAKLFTHAHLPDRATQARAVLPEAARDCAFARRSVGPILRTASWYAQQNDMAQTHALLLEAADRLTRPHYHVYDDADPALGGSALAAMALGLQHGLLVPPPYDSVF